jgi:hypothetical protein
MLAGAWSATERSRSRALISGDQSSLTLDNQFSSLVIPRVLSFIPRVLSFIPRVLS